MADDARMAGADAGACSAVVIPVEPMVLLEQRGVEQGYRHDYDEEFNGP